MSNLLGKYACINEDCGSSDAMAVYENDEDHSAYCWSCRESFSNNQLADSPIGEELGIDHISRASVKTAVPKKKLGGNVAKQRKEVISQDNVEALNEATRFDDTRYRKLSQKVNEKYGVRSEFDDNGVLIKRYYPVNEGGIITGYKIRELPKVFYAEGRNDLKSEMFGQHLFPNGGKYLLIVGGEEDAMAAYEMLRMEQVQRQRGDLPPIAVVSPTVGETGCYKQLQNHYEWIDQFDNVILMFDNDEAGQEATQQALTVLPMGKVKVATLPMKDPCDMRKANRQAEFVREFYQAKKHQPAGVLGSSALVDRILERANMVKVPLPPFAKKLQKMMAGGIPLGYIVNIAAGSGLGKTTLVNEFVYYWIFHSPYKVGIVSLESDPGEYGELLLSRHVEQKIALLETVEDKLSFLGSDRVQDGMQQLFFTEDGDDRFHLLDHQGSVGEDQLKQKCEYLVKGLGCKLIIVDPLTLALTGAGNEEMDEFMSWQKKFVDEHKCVFVNVTHVRKNSSDQKANSKGGTISEESIKGSGSIFQVAGANILLMRDKENEDPQVRNTTRSVMSKCRWTGNTGASGDWYYSNQNHQLHDFDDYFNGESQIPDSSYQEDQDLMQPVIEADRHDGMDYYQTYTNAPPFNEGEDCGQISATSDDGQDDNPF